MLEGAHYTKPVSFRGMEVPEVLRSGHAQKIARWRRESALRRTWRRRPELLLSAELDEADRQFLAMLASEQLSVDSNRLPELKRHHPSRNPYA